MAALTVLSLVVVAISVTCLILLIVARRRMERAFLAFDRALVAERARTMALEYAAMRFATRLDQLEKHKDTLIRRFAS